MRIGGLLLILSFTHVGLALGQVYAPDSGHHRPTPSAFRSFLEAGAVHGHIRNFFMTTQNQSTLTDYYANATGGALHYETGEFWGGFQLGVKGIFTFNTFSTDLLYVDPIAQKSAKWEIELFDVNHPEEKHDLDRLEELYLKYNFGEASFVEVGKIDLDETPLLNRRDGRMKPFAFQGMWADVELAKNHRLQGGWIHKVSPRAMTEFFTLQEAIGLKSQGVQPNGTSADYHEAVLTRGVGMLGWKYAHPTGWQVQAWETYLDRLTNTLWLQADWKGKGLLAGVQGVLQTPLGYQATLPYAQRYYQPGEQGWVGSTRLGWHRVGLELSASYTHIFDRGRFLWPRELGRERLYTSIPRSWAEGLGNSDIMGLKGQYLWQKEDRFRVISEVSAAYVATPGRAATHWNKYQQPTYYQINADVRYECLGYLEGLTFELLYLYRGLPNASEFAPSVLFNTYQMQQWNVITQMRF